MQSLSSLKRSLINYQDLWVCDRGLLEGPSTPLPSSGPIEAAFIMHSHIVGRSYDDKEWVSNEQ